MLPWMCGRATLTIVVSSPCMTQAQMIVAVIQPRLATGGATSPLTVRARSSAAASYGGAKRALGNDHHQLESIPYRYTSSDRYLSPHRSWLSGGSAPASNWRRGGRGGL